MKKAKLTLIHPFGFFILGILLMVSASMSVQAQTLTVQSPNGGETWTYGQGEIVTWTGSGLGSQIALDFSSNGGASWSYYGNAPSGPNGGSCTVSVPNIPTENALIRVSDAANPSVSDESNAPFTVFVAPITIFVPNGDSFVFNGISMYTNWELTVSGITLLNAELSTDNGATFTTIAQNLVAGLYYAYLPVSVAEPSDSCILRLSNAANPAQYGHSQLFSIRITDGFEPTITDTSDMFSVFPFPDAPICMVTVDSLNGFNTVVWEKPVTGMITDFLVYRETDESNVYEVIDTVSFDSVSVSVDPNSNPSIRPYRYKLGYIDTLSRIFPASNYHQTIHLTISQGVGDSWNLIWTPYLGFDYSTYRILRKSDEGFYEQIANVSASFNSYTDFNAPQGDVSYLVEVVSPGGCSPASRDLDYGSVYSNVASNGIVSVSENDGLSLTLYPIPADKKINVSFGETINGTVKLTISDLSGREIYTETLNEIRPGQVQSIDANFFKEGIYLLQITSREYNAIRKIAIKH